MTGEEYARAVERRTRFTDESMSERIHRANREARERLARLKATRIIRWPWVSGDAIHIYVLPMAGMSFAAFLRANHAAISAAVKRQAM